MIAVKRNYTELLVQYRMALSLWTEIRGLYPPETLEVLGATRHLQDLEADLQEYDDPVLAAERPPTQKRNRSVPPLPIA
jgi:hypothetical protein